MTEMQDKHIIDNEDRWYQSVGEKRVNMLEGRCNKCGANILVHPKETKILEAYYCIDCRKTTEDKIKYSNQDLGDTEPTEVDLYIRNNIE